MRGVFVDANGSLADIFEREAKPDDPPVRVNRHVDITQAELPAALDGAEIAIIDHTPLPTEIAQQCKGLKHVVFLGTGARSYMNPEELAALGIEVHLIKGYGDTAVAEAAIALMWASARGLAAMDREMRAGNWRHAGLDVFDVEPLPADHLLTRLPNVTLSAHSAFRTPEANENLIRAAWEHCRRIAKA